MTAQTLGDDRKMTDAIICEASNIALVENDRVFATAINPGLTQVATLGDPAAALVLANLKACRSTPPRLAEARHFLQIAAKSPVWKEMASMRLQDIDDASLCERFTNKCEIKK